jgi:hypothetical protein
MGMFKKDDKKKKEHERVQKELDKINEEVTDMSIRLMEVEAAVGIHKPPVLRRVEGGNGK